MPAAVTEPAKTNSRTVCIAVSSAHERLVDWHKLVTSSTNRTAALILQGQAPTSIEGHG